MAKYIEREAVLNILASKNAPWDRYQKVSELPAADVQSVKWIPVTERLPEENGFYLCLYEAKQPGGIAMDEGLSILQYLDNKWHLNEIYTVTHWLPLPEPPSSNEL